MKNKIVFVLPLLTILLTSCTLLPVGEEFFRPFSNSQSTSEQSSSSYSHFSTSIENSLEKQELNYTIKDYSENSVYPIDSSPCVGETNFLVFPIWFTDSSKYIPSAKKETVRQDIEKVFFGTNEETGWRSVSSYYEEASLGSLNIKGTVADWYECGKPYSRLADRNNGGDETNSLVKEVVNWWRIKNNYDTLRDYDTDLNGFLDGVILIYGGPDFGAYNNNENYENAWAYCFWIQDEDLRSTAKPGPNVFLWASYDFMYGYDKGIGNYYSGDTRHCKLDAHTYIHETGHMLGLEDYYDYSYQYSPVGGFTMMDENVGSLDPFSRLLLGWSKPYVVTNTTAVSINPFEKSGDVILIAPEYGKSPFDEYVLIDYYTGDGLNEVDSSYSHGNVSPLGTKNGGIRIWHVDARLLYTKNGSYRVEQQTSNPKTVSGYVNFMNSNTYYDKVSKVGEDYISVLGRSYANYNLLQLIRRNPNRTYQCAEKFSATTLFVEGDTFTLDKYSKQFVNESTLNNGKEFNFQIDITSLSKESAVISITKLK